MKKTLFLFLLLAIVAMSCQKDIAPIGSITPVVEQSQTLFFNSTLTKMSENDDIEQRINSFKARLTPKSGFGSETDQISVNDAVWGIEAVLNHSYCRADAPFETLDVASSVISVPLTDGRINVEDVTAAIVSARNELGRQWRSVSGVKRFNVIDISVESQNRNTANFTVRSALGSTPEITLRSFSPPAQFVDDWWDGDKAGKCNNTSINNDAATEIARKMNARVSTPQILYYTDNQNVETNYEKKYNIDVYTSGWMYVALTGLSSTSMTCLTAFPLNDLLLSQLFAIDHVQPCGKTFISMTMKGGFAHNDFGTIRQHDSKINFGKAHYLLVPLDQDPPVPCDPSMCPIN